MRTSSKDLAVNNSKKMYVTFLFLLVIVTTSITQVSSSSSKYIPGGKQMLIYGIYQSCSGNSSYVRSNITRESDVCRQSVEWMDSKKMEVNSAIIEYYSNVTKGYNNMIFPDHLDWNMRDIKYKSLYICSPTDLELEVAKLLLDQDNFVEIHFGAIPENMWNGEKIYLPTEKTRFQHTRILAVFLHADEKTSTKAIHLLANSQFPIYHLKDGWTAPETDSLHFQKEHVFSEKSVYRDITSEITKTLRRKKTYYFFVIYFSGASFIQNEIYERYRSFLESQSEFCFKIYKIQPFDGANATIGAIQSDPKLRLILMFGNPSRQLYFLKEAISQGLIELSWIFQDVNIHSYLSFRVPRSTSILTLNTADSFYDYIIDLEWNSEHSRNDSNLNILSKHNNSLYEIKYLCKLKMVSLINAYILGLWKQLRIIKRSWYGIFLTSFRKNIRSVFKDIERFMIKNRFFSQLIYRFRNKVLNTTCFIPVCKIGRKLKSVYNGIHYGLDCVPCSENHYKNNIGNTSCIPCPKFTVSTTARDSCYDPYKQAHLSLNQWSVLIAFFMNGVGGVFSVFTVLVLLYKHDTPLVRAMDFKLSIFHLVSLSMTFFVTPYFYIMKPEMIICLLRPLCISVLNNLSVAFVIAKSQRLLKIFKSKLMIHSDGEIRRYNAYVGAGIFLICGIGQAFLLLPAAKIRPGAEEEKIDKEMIRDVFCNTEDYINIQLGYLIVLQLFTVFQAFRCRSLPGPFNEAMSIVYSTLIVIVTYSVNFPIYYFQHKESNKAIVHFVCLSVANIFSMLILYGKRLYIMVFKKKKNSKDYVRSRVWTFASDTSEPIP